MEDLWDIFKFLLPALLVWLACAFTQKRFFANEDKKRFFEVRRENHKTTLPIRIRAFERLIILLERISPENLILRFKVAEMTSLELHSELLKTIRVEFDHNLSQQLFVSGEVWALVKTARETLVKVLNSTATGVDPQSPAIELARYFVENFHNDGQSTFDLAKTQLQKEVSLYF